ncbi:MAG: hemin uptake protein HemP [Reyranellaceae bacterium]
MAQAPHPPPDPGTRTGDGEAHEAIVDSAALLQGRRQLIIRHGPQTYRLRLTASNKLILTK